MKHEENHTPRSAQNYLPNNRTSSPNQCIKSDDEQLLHHVHISYLCHWTVGYNPLKHKAAVTPVVAGHWPFFLHLGKVPFLSPLQGLSHFICSRRVVVNTKHLLVGTQQLVLFAINASGGKKLCMRKGKHQCLLLTPADMGRFCFPLLQAAVGLLVHVATLRAVGIQQPHQNTWE